MDRNIYRLLNEVEMDVNQYKEEEMNEIEIKKTEKYIKQHMRKGIFWKKKIAATVAVLCLGTGLLFNKQVYAFAESVGYKISSVWNLHNVEKYINVVNTSQQDQGYTITLHEVILDNDELIICETIHNDSGSGELLHEQGEIIINGVKISDMSNGELEMIDDYTQVSVLCYNISDMHLNDYESHEIKYNILGLDYIYKSEDMIKGDWSFHFTATGEELRKDTVEILLDEKINLPNGDVIVLEKYVSNPITQKIYYRALDIDNFEHGVYNIKLRGYDDTGVPVQFYSSTFGNGEDGDQGIFKVDNSTYEWEYEGINESPIYEHSIRSSAKQLVLTPYIMREPQMPGYIPQEEDEERLDQEIIINIK